MRHKSVLQNLLFSEIVATAVQWCSFQTWSNRVYKNADDRYVARPIQRAIREAKQCHYCNKKISGKEVNIDHREPWSNYKKNKVELANQIWNLLPSCERCNNQKQDYDYSDFVAKKLRKLKPTSKFYPVLLERLLIGVKFDRLYQTQDVPTEMQAVKMVKLLNPHLADDENLIRKLLSYQKRKFSDGGDGLDPIVRDRCNKIYKKVIAGKQHTRWISKEVKDNFIIFCKHKKSDLLTKQQKQYLQDALDLPDCSQDDGLDPIVRGQCNRIYKKVIDGEHIRWVSKEVKDNFIIFCKHKKSDLLTKQQKQYLQDALETPLANDDGLSSKTRGHCSELFKKIVSGESHPWRIKSWKDNFIIYCDYRKDKIDKLTKQQKQYLKDALKAEPKNSQ